MTYTRHLCDMRIYSSSTPKASFLAAITGPVPFSGIEAFKASRIFSTPYLRLAFLLKAWSQTSINPMIKSLSAVGSPFPSILFPPFFKTISSIKLYGNAKAWCRRINHHVANTGCPPLDRLA